MSNRDEEICRLNTRITELELSLHHSERERLVSYRTILEFRNQRLAVTLRQLEELIYSPLGLDRIAAPFESSPKALRGLLQDLRERARQYKECEVKPE